MKNSNHYFLIKRLALLLVVFGFLFYSHAQSNQLTTSQNFAKDIRFKQYKDDCKMDACYIDCKSKFESQLKDLIATSSFQQKFEVQFGISVKEFVHLNSFYSKALSSKLVGELCEGVYDFSKVEDEISKFVKKFKNDLLFAEPSEREELGAMYYGKYVKNPSPENPTPFFRGPGDPCTNADFEMCNYTGWETYCGDVNNAPFQVVNVAAYTPATGTGCAGSGVDQHLIVTGGNDPVVGIPMVNPNGGGNCSVRIGDGTGTNGKAAILRQTFMVDPNSTIFTYSYAAVLQDGGHTMGEQAFFRVRIYDQAGNSIQCGEYQAYAADGQAGWQTSGIIRYLNWTTVFAPLDAYIGQDVTIEVATGDCSQFGHWGYAYFEASCQPMDIVTSSPFVCQGQTVTLTAPPGAAQYQWSNGMTGQSIQVGAAGNYVVNMIPFAGAQCAIQLDIDIDLYPNPTAQFIHNAPVCQGSLVTFTDQSFVNGSTIVSWDWNYGNGANSNLQNGSQTYATAGTYNVSLTVTTVEGCTDTQTQTITIDPFLDPTITPAGPFCEGEPSHTFVAASPGGTWSATCGACINANTGVFTTNQVGNHTITYNIAGPCGGTNNIQVIVNPVFNPTVNPAGPFCEDLGNVSMTAATPGGTWSATCGACINVNTGVLNTVAAGVGIHTITYSFNIACPTTDNIQVQILPRANATMNPVAPLCHNAANVQITTLQPGGNFAGNGIINGATGEFSPALAGPGTHTITYLIGGQCGDVETLDIVVYPPLTIVAFTDQAICLGQQANISAIANGGDGTFVINWNNGLGQGAQKTVAPITTTIYTATATDGCESVSADVTITIHPNPQPQFSADILQGCVPVQPTFTQIPSIPGSTCLWNFGDGTAAIDCGPIQHSYANPGCYDVTLTLTSPEGCSQSLIMPSYICAYPYPVANFYASPSKVSMFEPYVNFTNTSSSDAIMHIWDFSAAGSPSASMSVNPTTITYPGQPAFHTVCLTVENMHGCRDSICKVVEILDEPLIYVPNAFTPDNDGVNDFFFPVVNAADPENFVMYIFNRWGDIIYETHSLNGMWDGTHKGIPCKPDVYVWRILFRDIVRGEKHEYIGHVTLVK
ncbi:MAG: PKD domain-containing protein [Flavobacteriales bacterium]